MTPHKYLVLCAAIACCTVAARAQGTFQTRASNRPRWFRSSATRPARCSSPLRFQAQLDTFGVPGVLSVSLDGVNIPYVSLSSGPNYTLYGGDISPFAGRTAELGFSLFGGAGIDYSIWNLDSIEFSDLAVPEPSVLGLSLLGALLLGWRHWRKHR